MSDCFACMRWHYDNHTVSAKDKPRLEWILRVKEKRTHTHQISGACYLWNNSRNTTDRRFLDRLATERTANNTFMDKRNG